MVSWPVSPSMTDCWITVSYTHLDVYKRQVVTIGASTTAMYYVTLKLVRDEDGYTFRSFFKSFKENFKQSTIIWLIFLVAGIVLGVDVFFFLRVFNGSQNVRTIMLAIFMAMSFLYFAMFTFVFPLQARFYNPVKRTIFNAFFMSIRHLFQTIGMLVIDVGVVFLAFTYLPQIILFGVALIAFLNSYILASIFKKYMPEDAERRDSGEMRPLFADEDEEKVKIQETEHTENETNE